MKSSHYYIFTLLLIFLFAACAPSEHPRKTANIYITPINNRDYFPAVHNLISNAQSEIHIIMYKMPYYVEHPEALSNCLVNDLIKAQKRDVSVNVILEAADWNFDNSETNLFTGNILKRYGVNVYYEKPKTTSHNKLILIDGNLTVLGSTNWNHYALNLNNEAAVMIESDKIYAEYRAYWDEILSQSTPEHTVPIHNIELNEIEEHNSHKVTLIAKVSDVKSIGDGDKYILKLDDEIPLLVFRNPLKRINYFIPNYFDTIKGKEIRFTALVENNEKYGWQMIAGEFLDEQLQVQYNTYDPLDVPVPFDKTRKLYTFERFEIEDFAILNNEDYFDITHNLINGAKDNISIAMLDARYYDDYPIHSKKEPRPEGPWSLTNFFRGDLDSALYKNVEVEYIYDYYEKKEKLEAQQSSFLLPLLKRNAKIYKDPGDYTTHCKLIIIDDEYVILGSTNWSYYALEENNESSIMLHSKQLNKFYRDYFEEIKKSCQLIDINSLK